ncbi:hypothetical protein WCP94_003409 [Bilophila wadsworthia]
MFSLFLYSFCYCFYSLLLSFFSSYLLYFIYLCYLNLFIFVFSFLVIQSDLEKSRMNLLVLSSLVNGSLVSN